MQVVAGNDPPALEPAPARRRGRRATSSGRRRPQKSLSFLIALDLTGGRHAGSSRLCVKSRRNRWSDATVARRRIESRSWPYVNSIPCDASGVSAWTCTSPTGFSARAAAGPRDAGHRDRDVRTRAARARPRPSPPPSPRRPRRAARASPQRRRARAPSRRSRTRRSEPTKTSLEPGTDVSRAATIPPVHDSAVASVQPRARQSSSTISSTPRSSSLKRCRAEPLAQRVRKRVRRPVQVDVDLEVARADGRRDPRRLSPGLRERPRNLRLARAEEAEDAVLGRLARGPARAAPAPSPARAATAAAARAAAPAGRRRRRVPASSTSPGAVPASPSETAPSGSVACLRTPVSKSAYGRRSRSANALEIRSISAFSPSSTRSGRPAARATSSTVRSSCVGPRPPETTHRSARSPSTKRSLELVLGVADDRDQRRLEPEAHELAREERPVAVVPVARGRARCR